VVHRFFSTLRSPVYWSTDSSVRVLSKYSTVGICLMKPGLRDSPMEFPSPQDRMDAGADEDQHADGALHHVKNPSEDCWILRTYTASRW
jgi:hypothetical protein